MPDRETLAFLATVPLLEGLEAAELEELARVVRRRTAPAGRALWNQGDQAREVLFVVDGAVSVRLEVPGGRTVEIARARRGNVLGEIALLDGREHAMSLRVTEPATLLALSRLDFAALLAGQRPSAFRLRRRLVALAVARLRAQIEQLAVSLGGDAAAPRAGEVTAVADLEPCRPPDSAYLQRMATFHDFDAVALWGFLTSGKYVRCPPRHTLLAEGTPSSAYHLVVNGAVEKVLVRGDRGIRVGLAGPGMAFGYESLIDRGPSPVTAITRERAVLLVLPGEVFASLFHAEGAIARVFLLAVQRDLLATLRQTLRPSARLAASV
jgi:CRP-like cAMP-binding protein